MPRLKTKRPEKNKASKSKRSLLIKIILVLILIPMIAAAVFMIRYYYIFDRAIEMKLGQRNRQFETKIFAAPTVLYPGKRLSQSELVSRIRRLGYEEDNTGSCYYKIGKSNTVLIHNDGSVMDDANRTAEIVCAGNAIRSMKDSAHQTELSQFSLKPELLSNAIDKSREKRRYVTYQEMPQVLINAVLAAEDRRFFSHRGIDPIRIVQALIVDIREGDTTQGASTLTQQFVKNYFLTPERTWRRKFADAYMSILLEQRLSKTEIFELYSNEVYLGQAGSFSIVGFGKAADAFFDKNVRDLTLEEAATIAGMITAPNRHTPLRYKDRALARRNLVLDQMADYGMITVKERDAAKAKPLIVKPVSFLNYSDAPYFVDYVQNILMEKYGDASLALSKFRIYTSLNTDLQQAAFESVQSGMNELDSYFAKRKQPIAPGTVQASLIAVDPKNGHILAMIGGRNYGASQFNRITQSKRQPGSIFKPFVYATALETAYHSTTPLTAASAILDEPTQFTIDDLEYEPKNFKDEYLGQVTMRQAITKSLNNATIKFAEKVGYEKVAELAQRLGLNEKIKPYPAMAIGTFEITPLEMVRAYTAFANGGLLSDLTAMLEVYDSNSNPVFISQPKTKQVITPQIAFMVTSLLQSVIDHGTGYGARERGFTLPAAGKTGTSHDGWFAGYTPDLLCIVWVGFDDNRELSLSGSQSALPIWADFMKKAIALRPLKGETFAVPEDVVQVEIDPTTGLLATEHCLQREMEYYIKGTEPLLKCYGNNYEQSMGRGGPVSIYATPSKETPSGADNKKEPSVR
ncbi:MAG TPA: PBP1A family penicillin-binding protein [Acidobacteriota bacterium]|nr:PBP1A family penicillin-binding protein [Acidobacteriota bacterium]